MPISEPGEPLRMIIESPFRKRMKYPPGGVFSESTRVIRYSSPPVSASGSRVRVAMTSFMLFSYSFIRLNQRLTKKSQKANFTLLTEPVYRIFWGNTDFLVSPQCERGVQFPPADR
jgi:hypothetical protein